MTQAPNRHTLRGTDPLGFDDRRSPVRRAVVATLIGIALASAGSAAATPPPPRPYEGPGVGVRSDGSVCVYKNDFSKTVLVCTPPAS